MPQTGFFPAVGMHSEGEEVRIAVDKTLECKVSSDELLYIFVNMSGFIQIVKQVKWLNKFHAGKLSGNFLFGKYKIGEFFITRKKIREFESKK